MSERKRGREIKRVREKEMSREKKEDNIKRVSVNNWQRRREKGRDRERDR